VIRSLTFLSHDDGLRFLKAIAQQVFKLPKDKFAYELLLSELIPASLEIDRAVAREVMKADMEVLAGGRELDRLLDQVLRVLCGHSIYREFATNIRQGETRYGFLQIGVFFREDSPLKVLDQLSREKPNLDELTELANKLLDEADRALVRLIGETLRSSRIIEHRDRVADFLIGVIAAKYEHQALDTADMNLHDAVYLLASDLPVSRYSEALLERLGEFDENDVTAALVDALERVRNAYGGVWVAQAMGERGWESFVAPLIAAIGEECGDFLCEAARTALIQIGGRSSDYLIEHWDALDQSAQIYGLSVIDALGGERAASFAVDHYDELMPEDPERWCQLALSAPDRRLLDLVEEQLPRRQRIFDETFYVLAHLLDVNHPELDAVGERVEKAKSEQRERRAAFQRGEWFEKDLTLELKCPECGHVNEYKVKQVVVNENKEHGGPVLADEFPCASCGRWVDFEFAAGAHIAITAELLKLTSNGDQRRSGQSNVLITAEAPYYGRKLPVAEVISRCKEAIASDPNSIADWLRLGLCYHQILSRPRYAVSFAERALQLEPRAVEAVFQTADAMAVKGDVQQAFQLLDQALESRKNWRFFLTDVAGISQFTAHFARLYNELLVRLGKSERPRLHASFLGTSQKVGRNDPCPCGSGKKYKKCCLAKH
jgi:tetratricopeptide (TPR) repeat protein